MTAGMLLGYNAVAVMLMVIGVRLAAREPRHGWIAVALATAFVLNAVFHVAATMASGAYSPGLASAVVLWLPIGLLTLTRALYQATRPILVAGLAVGAVIHAIVIALTVA